MFTLNPKSFRFRIAASYILLCFIILFFIISGFFFFKGKTSSITTGSNEKVVITHSLSENIFRANSVLKDFMSLGNHQLIETRKTIASNIINDLKLLEEQVSTDDRALVNTIANRIGNLIRAQEKIEQFVINARGEILDISSDDGFFDSDDEQTELAAADVIDRLDLHLDQVKKAFSMFDMTVKPLHDQLGEQFAHILRGQDGVEEDKGAGTGFLTGFFFPLLLLSIIVLFILSFVYIDSMIQKSITRAKKPLKILSSGNLPENEEAPENEMGAVIEEINVLAKNLGRIKDFALEVGSGHYDSQISIFDNKGEIGKSLSEMRNSLRNIAADEKERNWLNEGFAKFSDVLRQNGDNLNLLSQNVISQLVKYLNANQGGIFIVNDENRDNIFLELTACYAYERNKYLKKQILPGEGLVGQCFMEKKSIYMTDVPQDYISIKSGLGGSNPGNIFIVPLMVNQDVFGIIELASFNSFRKVELEFIEKAAESIASTISSVKITENTKMLLEASQMAAEQLKSQEEEMRQNMEELAATQEEMHRKQKSIIENEQKTRLIFLNAFDAIITTDENGIIDLFNPAAEKIFGYTAWEIKGQSIDLLVSKEFATKNRTNNPEQKDIFGLIGVSREIDVVRKNGNSFKMKVKMEEGLVGNQRIHLLFIEEVSSETLDNNILEELEKYKMQKSILQNNLEKKDKWVRDIFDNIIHPVIKIDRQGNIFEVNAPFEKVFLYSSHDAKSLSEILPGLNDLGGIDFLFDCKGGGRLKFKAQNKDGHSFEIDAVAMADHDENYCLLFLNREIDSSCVQKNPDLLAIEEMTRQKLSESKTKMAELVKEESRKLTKKKKP
jgi:PAS domain S-box-containing protein